MASSLHQASLEVFQALISSSQYNLQSLLNSGLIRTICANFDAFKIRTDIHFDSFFNVVGSQTTTAKGKWERSQLVHQELADVKFVSFNYLFQSFHTLDMLLNNLTSPQQALQAFPIDCLQHFKPVVEILEAILTWKGTLCEVSLLVSCVERIKTFFEQLKRNLYNATGAALMSQSRSKTHQTVEAVKESKEYQFATHMAKFLDNLLQEKGTSLNKYLSQTDGVFLCHCFAAGGQPTDTTNPQGDRIFEVESQIKYEQLQQQVDQKFSTQGSLIQYIGELDDNVTVDSDLVLKKAVQRAIQQAYYDGENQVTLRLLVFSQPGNNNASPVDINTNFLV